MNPNLETFMLQNAKVQSEINNN